MGIRSSALSIGNGRLHGDCIQVCQIRRRNQRDGLLVTVMRFFNRWRWYSLILIGFREINGLTYAIFQEVSIPVKFGLLHFRSLSLFSFAITLMTRICTKPNSTGNTARVAGVVCFERPLWPFIAHPSFRKTKTVTKPLLYKGFFAQFPFTYLSVEVVYGLFLFFCH